MRISSRGSAMLAAVLLVAACGGSSSQPPASAGVPSQPSVQVVIKGNTLPDVSAEANQVITWTNDDAVSHTVTLDDESFDATIPGGKTASTAFTEAGTYPYHCAIHPSMKGTITIS